MPGIKAGHEEGEDKPGYDEKSSRVRARHPSRLLPTWELKRATRASSSCVASTSYNGKEKRKAWVARTSPAMKALKSPRRESNPGRRQARICIFPISLLPQRRIFARSKAIRDQFSGRGGDRIAIGLARAARNPFGPDVERRSRLAAADTPPRDAANGIRGRLLAPNPTRNGGFQPDIKH